MLFPDPLLPGRLVKRYKRFLSDVALETGEVVTAHCPNPGSMMGLDRPGSKVWLSPARAPQRKLRYTFEMVAVGEGLVGINTSRTNGLAAEAVEEERVPELGGYASIRREVRYGENSRIDLLLEAPCRPPCYVEVKNVTLKRDTAVPGAAEFPDAVTARGAKHMRELARVAAGGGRAVLLYVIQREDCDRLGIAGDIDPRYQASFDDAVSAGVEVLCYACELSPYAIELKMPLPLAHPDTKSAFGAGQIGKRTQSP